MADLIPVAAETTAPSFDWSRALAQDQANIAQGQANYLQQKHISSLDALAKEMREGVKVTPLDANGNPLPSNSQGNQEIPKGASGVVSLASFRGAGASSSWDDTPQQKPTPQLQIPTLAQSSQLMNTSQAPGLAGSLLNGQFGQQPKTLETPQIQIPANQAPQANQAPPAPQTPAPQTPAPQTQEPITPLLASPLETRLTNTPFAPLLKQSSAGGNHEDTSSATDPDNPRPAGKQTYIENGPNGKVLVTVDRSKILSGLVNAGHGDMAMQFMEQWKADDLKAQAVKTTAALAQSTAINQAFAGLHNVSDSVKDAYIQAQKKGLAAQGIDTSSVPDTYKGNEGTFQALEDNARTVVQRDLLAHNRTEEALKAAEDAETKRNNIAKDTETSAQRTETARHDKAQEGVEWYKAKNPKGMGGMGSVDADPSQPLPSPVLESMAQTVADGGKLSTRDANYDLITARARNIYAANNKGDATGFGTTQGVVTANRKSFEGSGNNAQTINTVNVVGTHIKDAFNLTSTDQNTRFPAYNRLRNWIKEQTGNDAPVVAGTLMKVAATEMLKAVKNSNILNEHEEKDMEDKLHNARSPEQIRGVLQEFKHIIQPRVDAANANYERAYPGHNIGDRLTPDAQEMFNYKPTVFTTPAPTTGVSPAPSKGGAKSSDDLLKALGHK